MTNILCSAHAPEDKLFCLYFFMYFFSFAGMCLRGLYDGLFSVPPWDSYAIKIYLPPNTTMFYPTDEFEIPSDTRYHTVSRGLSHGICPVTWLVLVQINPTDFKLRPGRFLAKAWLPRGHSAPAMFQECLQMYYFCVYFWAHVFRRVLHVRLHASSRSVVTILNSDLFDVITINSCVFFYQLSFGVALPCILHIWATTLYIWSRDILQFCKKLLI